jgi:WD40 repeat protein
MNKSLPTLLLRVALLTTLIAAAPSFTCGHAAAQAQANSAAQLKRTLKGHKQSIVEILFSPDGETIATGSEDGTVRLWNARTGEARATLKLAKKLQWLLLVWSPDSRQLATCRYQGFGITKEANIWDAQTGALLSTLAGHGSSLNSLEWSADGQTILTASDDGTAKLWDAATWQLRRTIEYQQVDVSRETGSMLKAIFTRKKIPDPRNIHARFAGGGRTILIHSANELPQLWSVEAELIAPLYTWVERVAHENISYLYQAPPLLSRDGRFIATSNERDGTRLWDGRTGQLRHFFDEKSAHAFSPDGRTLVTASWERGMTLRSWNVETGELRQVWKNVADSASRIYWSPEGKSLIVNGIGEMKPRLIDPNTGAVKARLPYEGCSESLFTDNLGCEPFIFNADGRIASKLTGTLKLFSAATGEQLTTLEGTNRRAVFSPTDARLLAARSRDKKSLMLFEVAAH